MVSLKQERQSGFTIVELLIVIIIIGILAGLVITQVLGANQQARDTDRKNDINSIATQLEAYFAKTGGYPQAGPATDADSINNSTWRTNNSFNAGDGAKAFSDPMNGSVITLQDSLPSTTNRAYQYLPAPTGCVSPTVQAGTANTGTFCTSYQLVALLENSNDSQKDTTITSAAFYVKRNANQ